MSCYIPLSIACQLSTQRVFEPSFNNVSNIFIALSAGQIRQNCRATLVNPPGTSVATIVTIWCNHRDGKYFLDRITRKLGSKMKSTVITRLRPLRYYLSIAVNETLWAILGHTNRNIEMSSPSPAVMVRMVAAAKIVRFLPVHVWVINILIAFLGARYIRGLVVHTVQSIMIQWNMSITTT